MAHIQEAPVAAKRRKTKGRGKSRSVPTKARKKTRRAY